MTDVFISYSRRDKIFTQKLVDALQAANREVWADWASIPAASDWDAEIKEGIEKTNTVLFLLSPEWIKSNECRKELLHALQMGKKLIPILYIMPDQGQEVPPELAKINWVYMRETDDFNKAFEILQSAMDTDLDWVKTHTRIQVRAIEWNKKNRDNSLTLRGNDLSEGEQFMSQGSGKNPEPTPLQGELILASRKDATRRQRITLAGVTVALVVSVALGIVAYFQRQEAINQASIALSLQLAAQAQTINLTLPSHQQLAVLLAVQSAKINPSSDATSILLNKFNASKPVSFMSHDDYVAALDFSPDGRYIASGSWDNTARVWDVNTGTEIARINHNGPITNVSFSPDGKYLLSGALGDQTTLLWEASTGKEVLNFQHESLSSAFSPNGKYIITGGYDGLARIWNASTGAEITQIVHGGQVNTIAFSKDGQYIATGSADGSVHILKVGTWDEITLVYHDGNVTSVALAPNAKYLISGSDDRTARIWNVATGEEIARINHSDIVSSVSISDDGQFAAATSLDHTISTWKVPTGEEIYRFTVDGQANKVLFSSDSNYIIAANKDNTARFCDVTTGE